MGREDAGAPGMEGGELECVLIGFCPAVDQEELVVVVTAGLSEADGQLLLELVDHGVGVEPQLSRLAVEGFHVMGMAVTDADDGMPAIEVEVFHALVIPYLASLSFDDVDIEQGVNVV